MRKWGFYLQRCKYSQSTDKKTISGGGGNTEASKHTKILKPYSNFHLQDIFGNYHRFFRPYTYKAKELVVRLLPNAYASMEHELVFTQSKKALLSYTSNRTHILSVSKNPSFRQKLKLIASLCKNWLTLFYCKKIVYVSGNVALLTRDVGDCYGHFIREVMVGVEQVRRSNKKIDFYILPHKMEFQKQMLELLRIQKSQLIIANPKTLIKAQTLIIPTLLCEYELIEYRANLHYRALIQSAITPYIYRNLLNLQPYKNPTRKIFLTRPKDSNRNIENLGEVEEVFSEFGFEIILPDSHSIQEQINILRESKIVASMHGSGLDNVIFANDKIAVLELFSEFYHDNNPQLTALLKHCKYFYLIGKTSNTSMHPQKESAYFAPNELRKALCIMKEYVDFS